MENAVKALLIAAAVLIAILIISLGLVVYNRASETVNSAGDLSEYQIQQFNEKFLKYQGTSVSGTDVNALLQTVTCPEKAWVISCAISSLAQSMKSSIIISASPRARLLISTGSPSSSSTNFGSSVSKSIAPCS